MFKKTIKDYDALGNVIKEVEVDETTLAAGTVAKPAPAANAEVTDFYYDPHGKKVEEAYENLFFTNKKIYDEKNNLIQTINFDSENSQHSPN